MHEKRSAPRAADAVPATQGGSDALWSCIAELEELAALTRPAADRLAASLGRLRQLQSTTKARSRAVAAARTALEKLQPENIAVGELAGLLQGLQPAYLGDGTRPALFPLLRTALPWLFDDGSQIDAEVASSLLGGLGGLPLDEMTKGVAGDAVVTLAPRLRELVVTMTPEQVAGCVQALRLIRGSERPLLLELLGLLLDRAAEVAERFSPRALAGLSRGLLGIRIDPVALGRAAALLSVALEAVAPRVRELALEDLCDVLAMVAAVGGSESAAAEPAPETDGFAEATLPLLDARIGALRPVEFATVVRGLAFLRLGETRRREATAFAQKALRSLGAKDFTAFEASRILGALSRLSRDAGAAAFTGSFAVATSEMLGTAAERLPVRDLADVASLLGSLPVEPEGRKRLRKLAQTFAASIREREGKLTDAERARMLVSFDALGATAALGPEIIERWRRLPPVVAPPPAPSLAPSPATPEEAVAPHVVTPAAVEVGPEPELPAAAKRAVLEPASRSLREAAAEIGVAAEVLAAWVREDPELAAVVKRSAGRPLFASEAIEVARQIHALKLAEGGGSVAGAAAAPDARDAARPSMRTRPKPGGLGGVEAARALGMARQSLYALMRRHGIAPPGAAGFTPELLDRIRGLRVEGGTMTSGPAAATPPSSEGAPDATPPAEAGPDPRGAALVEVIQLATAMIDSLGRMTAEFRGVMRALLDQQGVAFDIANRPITMALEVEEDGIVGVGVEADAEDGEGPAPVPPAPRRRNGRGGRSPAPSRRRVA